MGAWGRMVSNTKRTLQRVRATYSLPKIAVGLIAYLLILATYMQPIIANGCNQTYLGGPGDQSAFAWLYEASPDSGPLWGTTTWTNAPDGENLSEPFYITGLLQYTSTWVLEKAVGSTCAFNVYAGFGHLFTATVVFFFIIWLTRTRYYFVAWLAGWLVAFSPYLQIKTTHHVSYVYSGLLVIILWVLMKYWQRPTLRLAITFMIACSLLFYHDPYFIMLGLFLCIAFFCGTFIYHWRFRKLRRKEIWGKLKYLVWALPVAALLVAPVAYVRVSQNSRINHVVGNSRDTDIMAEGKAYSARPWEFLLPATTNPFTPEALKVFQNSHQHGTDNIETTLYLGYVTLGLAGVYTVHWVRKKRKENDNESDSGHASHQHASLVAFSLTIVGGLMALPPYMNIGQITLYFPSWLLLSATTMWRMPARFFVLLQLGLVILAAFGLIHLINWYKSKGGKRVWLIYVALTIISVAEFLTFNPLSRRYWSQSMIPAVYSEIKANDSVDRIAEYPMLDPPRNFAFIFYLSYQAYHQKPMINSAKAGSATKQYRESLADIYDWQTVGALRALGVDRVVVHGAGGDQVSLSDELAAVGASYDTQTTTPVISFKATNAAEAKKYLLTISDGFDGPSNYGFSDIDFYMHQSGTLRPVLLPGATKQATATARIEYYAFERSPRQVRFVQDGVTVATVAARETKQIVEFAIDPQKPISIVPDDPPADYSFVVSNMEIK